MRRILWLLMILCTTVLASATVTSEGLAELRKKATAADKDKMLLAAYRDALSKIREEAVGDDVTQAVWDAKLATLSLNQIEDAVEYKQVIRENDTPRFYRIHLSVDFDEAAIKEWFADGAPAGVQTLQERRIMVVIPEEHIQRRVPDPAGETEVINKLLAAGFRVVDKKQLETVANRDQALAAAMGGDNQALVKIAQEFGADFLIYGEAFSHAVDPDPRFPRIRPVQARVEARMVSTDTGEVLLADGREAAASNLSELIASKEALRKAGGALAESFINVILKKAAQGRVLLPVVLKFNGMTSSQSDKFADAWDRAADKPGKLSLVSDTAGDVRYEVKTDRRPEDLDKAVRLLMAPIAPFDRTDLSNARIVYAIKPVAAYKPPVDTAPYQETQNPPRPPAAIVPAEGIDISGEKWRALLIGIDDYSKTPFDTLKAPVNDVNTLAGVLRDNYGFQVETILNQDATFRNVRKALNKLVTESSPDENLLIYYAGHGHIQPSGLGVWLTADAQDEEDGMSNAEIKEHVTNMPARRILLISDSCYSGDFLKRAIGKVKYEQVTTEAAKIQKISSALAANKMAAREVITSGNLNPVADSGTGPCRDHSPFACVLIDTLRSVPVGGVLGTTDLYGQIWQAMQAEAEPGKGPQRGQLPQHKGGEFFFVRVK